MQSTGCWLGSWAGLYFPLVATAAHSRLGCDKTSTEGIIIIVIIVIPKGGDRASVEPINARQLEQKKLSARC
jgi:hypothetical protein